MMKVGIVAVNAALASLLHTGGEFCEITGDLLLDKPPKHWKEQDDWKESAKPNVTSRHFLFYFRDDTFECDAEDWSFDLIERVPAHLRHESG